MAKKTTKKQSEATQTENVPTVADLMPESPNLRAERLAELRRLFPDLFDGEGRLHERELRQLTKPDASQVKERYDFTWSGKAASKREAFTPSRAALVYDETRSVAPSIAKKGTVNTPANWPQHAAGNVIVEGDNLEVLKLLTANYRGKIKLIYIDPPYNTGKDFVYTDRFAEGKTPYWEETGGTDRGVQVDSNPDTDGRYHSRWLCVLYPILLASRYLLKDDGAIFVSIDEHELHNLRRLLESVFGPENFVAQATVLSNPKGRSQDKYFATNSEYVLVYSREPQPKGAFAIEKDEDQIEAEYPEEDDNGKFRYLELRNTHREFGKHNRPNLYYPFWVDKDGSVSLKKEDDRTKVLPHWEDGYKGCWTWEKKRAERDSDFLEARLVKGEWKVYRKSYANGADRMLKTVLTDKDFFTERGQKAFNSLFETKSKIFQAPKPPALIQELMKTITVDNDVILDFFAGSGTTGQAVMDLNASDDGNRNYILCQLPELTADDSAAYKAGYKRISDITIERNKRVIERYRTQADDAEEAAEGAEKALADAEKAMKKSSKDKLPGLEDGTEDKKIANLREKAEASRAEADKLRAFADGLGFKVYTLEKSAFPRVDFQPDPELSEAENIEKLLTYIEEKEAGFRQTWDRPRLMDEVLLKNGFSFDYELTHVDAFTENQVHEVKDRLTGRTALICLDDTIEEATLDAFTPGKPKAHAAERSDAFICLERALDTTIKWNLKHRLGDRLRAM